MHAFEISNVLTCPFPFFARNNNCSIYGSMKEVEAGAKRLAQVILGASHLAQVAVPALLQQTAEIVAWKAELRQTLEQQAHFLCRELALASSCLQVMTPQGAMYAMVRIRIDQFDESIRNDLDFAKLLLLEENVIVLPGTCFGLANSFRVVFCAPIPILKQAADRIHQFCLRHCSK